MPFLSKSQSKACFATHGFGHNVNCDEWAKSTNYKKLPNKVKHMKHKSKYRSAQMGGVPIGHYDKVTDSWQEDEVGQDLFGIKKMLTPQSTQEGCPPGYYFSSPEGKCVPNFTSQSIPSLFHPNPEFEEGLLANRESSTISNKENSIPKPIGSRPSSPKIDPYFALHGVTTGLSWLSGIVDRNRQNQYQQNQFSSLGQNNPSPVENYQPNPFSLYSKYGGSIKKYQRGGRSPIMVNNPNDPRLKAYSDSLNLYNMSQYDINNNDFVNDWKKREDIKNKTGKDDANITLKSFIKAFDNGSNKFLLSQKSQIKPIKQIFDDDVNISKGKIEPLLKDVYKKPVQPVVYQKPQLKLIEQLEKIFPKPTPAQSRPAQITTPQQSVIPEPQGDYVYGPANSVIGTNVNGKFVPYQGENTVGANGSQRGKVNKADSDLMNDTEALKKYLRGKGLQFKKGGSFMGINPDHKGYCTPMSKSTCTPRRKALAMTLKKHHGFHK